MKLLSLLVLLGSLCGCQRSLSVNENIELSIGKVHLSHSLDRLGHMGAVELERLSCYSMVISVKLGSEVILKPWFTPEGLGKVTMELKNGSNKTVSVNFWLYKNSRPSGFRVPYIEGKKDFYHYLEVSEKMPLIVPFLYFDEWLGVCVPEIKKYGNDPEIRFIYDTYIWSNEQKDLVEKRFVSDWYSKEYFDLSL